MFTGIIDHCGKVQKIDKKTLDFRITFSSQFADLILGESIAIDGACLTVASIDHSSFTVDVSPETMKLTNIGQYQPGTEVNLERALRLTDRLGGHFVTGHIDNQCRVSSIQLLEDYTEIAFDQVLKEYQAYLVKKGSITVNGVSLTLNEVGRDYFKVMLIPHTLQRTNLSKLQLGNLVNIEFDYLAKLIHMHLKGEQNESNELSHD